MLLIGQILNSEDPRSERQGVKKGGKNARQRYLLIFMPLAEVKISGDGNREAPFLNRPTTHPTSRSAVNLTRGFEENKVEILRTRLGWY